MAERLFDIRVTVKPPWRDIRGRFIKADAHMIEEQRDVMRVLGRRWVQIAREEAPSRTGKFRQSLSFKTFASGKNIVIKAYSPQPLGTWITGGTRPHLIVARRAKALRFLWEHGPKSTWRFTAYHFYKWIWHPGTKPNPYLTRAYTRWTPEAVEGLRKIARSWISEIG